MKTTRDEKMMIEIECVRVVCRRTGQIISFCGECRAETDFVPVSEATRIVQTDEATLFRLAETNALHWLPATDGEIYVCLASIERFGENRFV